MPTVYVSADSLLPADHTVETAYFYGADLPFGPPVQFDPGGNGTQETLLPASNTRTTFTVGSTIYKLLGRQALQTTVLVKSIDAGATWTVLDAAHTPLFFCCSGFYDETGNRVICAYKSSNTIGAAIRLIDFDLATELWQPVYPAAGPVTGSPGGASIAVWLRSDNTILVFYETRSGFSGGDPSGLGAVSYDVGSATWGTPFDVGANILLLTGWDSTQTIVQMNIRAVMDADILHVFFATTSVQTVPVIWGNRVFYQAILADDSLGTFFDFPGQVTPFPPFPYDFQQLTAFSGAPFGNPIVLNDMIVLPVLMRNDSLIDRFPKQLANVYIGTPVSAPVWTLDTGSTIDPGALVDDFIFPQEAPSLTYDGTTIFAVFPAQDEDGQNFARLRLCQTTNLLAPATGWTAQTIFDLQVDAPPGFNFAEQFLSGAGAFSPFSAPPPVVVLTYSAIDSRSLCMVPLPDPRKCK